MKILIDIPKDMDLRNYDIPYDILNIITNGTPLPKGHGELKDVDALYENTEIGHDEDGYACVTWKAINDAPTIIEAEGVRENENSD